MLSPTNPPIAFDGNAALAAPAPLTLEESLARLRDDDLLRLEDDLDFYAFTRVPTQNMLDILDDAGALDGIWAELCRDRAATKIAPIY